MSNQSFTRRAFCAGGMTLLSSMLLPQVEGLEDAFSLAPLGKAYADEGDSGQTSIMVVSRSELGIVAYDVTDAENPVALPEATVEITSRFNQQKLTGKTGSQGTIIFDLTDLAEDPNASILGFNGSIRITREGYREVYIPLTRIVSHAALKAPTRPLDGNPYFISLTMNEWDIQYSHQEYVTSASSTATQSIQGQLWLPDGANLPKANLIGCNKSAEELKLAEFKRIGSASTGADGGTLVTMEATGLFLKAGAPVCFSDMQSVKVDFLPEGANNAYRLEANIEANPAPLEESSAGDTFIIPDVSSSTLNLVKLPTTLCKPFAGATFSIWKPSLPVVFDFNILGYALFGIGHSDIVAKKDDGSWFSKDSYQTMPKQSVAEQAKAAVQKSVSSLDSYVKNDAASDNEKDVKTVWHKAMTDFKFYFNVQAFASLEYDWKKELWTGAFTGIVSGKFDYNITRQFWWGSVPMFYVVNPWASFQFSLRSGAQSKHLFSGLEWEDQAPVLGCGVSLGLTLTFGVGFIGLISASLTGAGYVTGYVSIPPNRGDKTPRYLAGYGLKLAVDLQLPLCKFSFPMYNDNQPTYYDSYNPKMLQGGDKHLDKVKLDDVLKKRLGELGMRDEVPVYGDVLPSFKDLKELAVIVTNDELKGSMEFETSLAGNYANAPVTVEFKANNFTAQDGEEALPDIVVATKDNFTASGNYLPQYAYKGSMDQLDSGFQLGIEGVSDGVRGGVKPNIDHLLFHDVNSNPGIRLLNVQNSGRTIMFRIASVDIGGGQMRTRLVYHQLNDNKTWSQPWVLNFDSQIDGVSRDDLYDYEFDVTQAYGSTGQNYIYVLVTSGTRPDGDNTGFVRGLQAHYVSLAAFLDTYGTEDPLQFVPSMSAGLPSTTDGYTITNPSITGFSDTFSIGGTNDFCVMGFFSRRKVDEEQGIALRGETIAFFGRQELDESYSKKVFKLTRQRSYLGQLDGAFGCAMLPVQIGDEDYKWEWGSVANCRRAPFAIMGVDGSSIGKIEATYKDHDSTKFTTFDCTELSFTRNTKLQINRFYPWNNGREFLASCMTTSEEAGQVASIYHVTFDPAKAGEPTYVQVGPKSGAVSDFVVDGSQHFLFYIENIDGKTGQAFDDDGNVTEEVEEHRHLIMAIAQVDGIFTQPFVFAELDHIIDGLVGTTVNGSYVTFLVNTITDIDSSLSDIYDVRVPLLKCLTPVKFFTVEPFVMSGEESEFVVEVRNDGNLIATGATFSLCDGATGEVIQSKDVVFEAANFSSVSNAGSNGRFNTKNFTRTQLANPLVKNNGQDVLLPGQSRTLHIDFDIPEDWHDEKLVHVQISNIEVIQPSGMASLQSYPVAASACDPVELKVDNTAQTGSEQHASGEVTTLPLKDFDSQPVAGAITVKKITGFKAKGKKKKVTLSWNKHKAQTTGFEIKYAASKKKLASAKTIKVKKASAKSYTVKSLKRKKRYYFKMRAYKTSAGKTYRSSWSAIKSAKTK